jgi:hypothetical protein
MSRFLEMLETMEGGISQGAARGILATAFTVTPYAVVIPMEDKSKLDLEENSLVKRVEKVASTIRE